MKPDFKNRIAKIALPAAFWLAVWQGAAAWVGQELLIPSPLAVLRQLGELAVTFSFWRSAGYSLLRIFCGALGGTVLGILSAVLTCCSRWADRVLSPALRIIRATPVASFIILLLLWFPTGRVPGIISGLMVLPVMWESVGAGIRNTPQELLEMSRAYHFGRRKTVRYVYIPAIRPHFASGVCNAIGLAWKSGVAAEVLCLPKASIGTQIYYSKIYLETPSLFAWTFVVIVLSLLLEKLVRRILGVKGGDAA
ncbi:MAG: ABC transporter permease subunit [Lachnospiraceae bacterium]|nr:ABC transporter permease subunit [Lachnospiraceae bacterium]